MPLEIGNFFPISKDFGKKRVRYFPGHCEASTSSRSWITAPTTANPSPFFIAFSGEPYFLFQWTKWISASPDSPLMKCSAPCPISDPCEERKKTVFLARLTQWIWNCSSSYSEDKCAPVRVEPGLKVTWTEWPLQKISDAVSFFHARLIGFSFLSSLTSPEWKDNISLTTWNKNWIHRGRNNPTVPVFISIGDCLFPFATGNCFSQSVGGHLLLSYP